jgi:hydrogenase expression/formation protein HypC
MAAKNTSHLQHLQYTDLLKILILLNISAIFRTYPSAFNDLYSPLILLIDFEMCLAIPMQIIAVDGLSARCEARGIEREISLFMLQDEPPAIGDYVMVSVGQAVRKVSEEDARLSWELYDLILAETPNQ